MGAKIADTNPEPKASSLPSLTLLASPACAIAVTKAAEGKESLL